MDDDDDWAYSSDASSLDLDVYDNETLPKPLATFDGPDSPSSPACSADDLPLSPTQGYPSSPKNYSYSSLNTTAREIRLLEILPLSRSGSIRCHVSIYHMDVAPVYVALSYEWGDPGAKRIITINQSRHTIRQNLYDFLSEIATWQKYKGCLFWIDAICIDQSNADERTHQVSMMANIYRQAYCVLAWLGQAEKDERVVMRTLGHLGPYASYETITGLWRSLSNRDRVAFRAVCERTYWRRLWVLQELALAFDCCIICGNHTLPWKVFEAVLIVAEAHALTESAFDDAIISSPASPIFNDGIKGQTAANAMRQQISQARCKATLVEQAIACGHLVCDEPLDHVYALLGLVSQDDSAVRPDYSMDAATLVKTVVEAQNAVSLAQADNNCRSLCQILGLTPGQTDAIACKVRSRRLAADNCAPWVPKQLTKLAKSQDLTYDLCIYVLHGQTASMKVLLDADVVDVNRFVVLDELSSEMYTGPQEMAPLHCAIAGGHIAAVRMLLDRPQVDVNIRRHVGPWGQRGPLTRRVLEDGMYKGMTLLHLACFSGNQELVTMLLERADIDVNVCCAGGMTPLHAACMKRTYLNLARERQLIKPWNRYQVIERLTSDPRTKLDASDDAGRTPLDLAFIEENNEAVLILRRKLHPDAY